MHYQKTWCITRICGALQETGTRNPLTGTQNPKQEQCLFTVLHFLLKIVCSFQATVEASKRHCSCFGFWVPVCELWAQVFCNLSLFRNVPTLTQNMLCNVPTHYKKMWHITRICGTLQKTGTSNPLTGTRNPKQEQCLSTVFTNIGHFKWDRV